MGVGTETWVSGSRLKKKVTSGGCTGSVVANILSWGSINRAGALSSSNAKMSLEKHLGQDMESCEPRKVYLCRYQRTVRN